MVPAGIVKHLVSAVPQHWKPPCCELVKDTVVVGADGLEADKLVDCPAQIVVNVAEAFTVGDGLTFIDRITELVQPLASVIV